MSCNEQVVEPREELGERAYTTYVNLKGVLVESHGIPEGEVDKMINIPQRGYLKPLPELEIRI